MSAVTRVATCIYALIVRLYPGAFRAEFEDEMRAVFAAAVADAAGCGQMVLLGVLWRELWDCPGNLLVAHWERVYKMKEVSMLTGSRSTLGLLRGDERFAQGFAALVSENAVLERLFDMLVASFFLSIAVPLCIILVVLIKLDSPGPSIFRQRRVGRNGQAYTMYKFRSMFCGMEGTHWPVSGERDPSFTRVGRFIRRLYLDELPQLFNVLKGEMSVFGPRPELVQ